MNTSRSTRCRNPSRRSGIPEREHAAVPGSSHRWRVASVCVARFVLFKQTRIAFLAIRRSYSVFSIPSERRHSAADQAQHMSTLHTESLSLRTNRSQRSASNNGCFIRPLRIATRRASPTVAHTRPTADSHALSATTLSSRP